ncbi:MAG TPA: hypothetical protein VE998_06435 [Terriglobales bacterium]|nr:hypothetical protein [Terriglobales bacterium]
MADLSFRNGSVLPRRTDWGAIWAGVFCFVAVFSVFGALGVAIFASNANPAANSPVLGQSVGMAIWAIVLTIIAMYVAGRETGRLADVRSRHDGLVHGLIMFGLAVVGLIVLASLGGTALTQGEAGGTSTHSPYALTVVADLGWTGFVALFLGWLAAMFSASAGVAHKIETTVVRSEPREIRPAA